MRDYTRFDLYLNKLAGDIYPQPSGNDEHTPLTYKVVNHWMSRLSSCKSVLDLGCGEGIAQEFFEKFGATWEGVCLGDDYLVARERGRNVKLMDFSFLDYPDESFDLLFSRHSLEHSPAPLLTLMEWARVSKQWLGIVLPAPEWYGYVGQNHYYVLNREQWMNLFSNSGWKVLWNEVDMKNKRDEDPESGTPHEYWFFLERDRK